MADYDPSAVAFVADRCSSCGEIALRTTELGERPEVTVRWHATKSATCDHMVLDSLSVTSG